MQRFKILLALFVVFTLILGTNMLDKNHFNTAQVALVSIYEDRLVAQNYIFQITTIIHEKELRLSDPSDISSKNKDDQKLEELIEAFSKTELTTLENRQFSSLKSHLKELKKMDSDSENSRRTEQIFQELKNDLLQLSEIQINEGRNNTHLAQKSLNTNQLLSNLEIGFLIVIGALLLFVIFYRGERTKKYQE